MSRVSRAAGLGSGLLSLWLGAACTSDAPRPTVNGVFAGTTGAGLGGIGGFAGVGGAAGGAGVLVAGGVGGAAGVGDSGAGGSAGGVCSLPGATDHFSFFVTSLEGLRRLSGSQDGFGGDLRFGQADGLSGADEICRQLAEASAPGAGCKTWRAFLSVTKDGSGSPVHAGDRIGGGPWYDRVGRLVALNKANLLQPWPGGPTGADPVIAKDLPNEFGVPNHDPDGTGQVDNHNTVTGTGGDGKLANADWAFTCHDWTSKVGTDGTPTIGFSWYGGAAMFPGATWYSSSITEGGCAPWVNLTNNMNFADRGIGARGGYGGFYCLALQP